MVSDVGWDVFKPSSIPRIETFANMVAYRSFTGDINCEL